MAQILTATSRYFLDTRSLPFQGLPESTGTNDPYLKALQHIYPPDLFPGGRYYDLPNGRSVTYF